MKSVSLEFAVLDLEDRKSFNIWLNDLNLFHEKNLSEWVLDYIKKSKLELENHSEFDMDVISDLEELFEKSDALKNNWIYNNRKYLIHLQNELIGFLNDIKEGNEFMSDLNKIFPTSGEEGNMIGLRLEKELNKKFERIRFGISVETGKSCVKRKIKPIIEDFESVIYEDLMRYINNGYELIHCTRCTNFVDNPLPGQLRNYRRGVNVYCKKCSKIHKREKNRRIKQNARRRNNVK